MDIQEAQTKIAAILKQLEIDNDVVVRDIDLHTMDITSIHSERREFQQSVVIDVERLPGNNWAT